MSDFDLQNKEPHIIAGEGEKHAVRRWLETARPDQVVDAILESGRDPLTGLLNRRGVDEETARVAEVLNAYEREIIKISPELAEAMKKESRLVGLSSVQVVAIDLSGFKGYNDKFGASLGDDALKAVSRGVLEVFSRTTDIHGRWGGDEFVVVAFNAPIDEDALRKMQTELNTFLPEGVSTYFSYSDTKPGESIDQKIQDAMDQLTVAKEQGPLDSTGRSLSGGLIYNSEIK
jgi:diguanylate cyclase (GGDEF)-like protein